MEGLILLVIPCKASNRPTSPPRRYAYAWDVGRQDMHDGMVSANNVLLSAAQDTFSAQSTAHIVLLVIGIIGSVAFMLIRLKPFIKVSRAAVDKQLPLGLLFSCTKLVWSCIFFVPHHTFVFATAK